MVKTQNIDSERLNEAIKKSGLKMAYIAEQLGISAQALNNKKNGRTSFRQSEVYVLRDLLSLSNGETAEIFFP